MVPKVESVIVPPALPADGEFIYIIVSLLSVLCLVAEVETWLSLVEQGYLRLSHELGLRSLVLFSLVERKSLWNRKNELGVLNFIEHTH